MSVPTIPRRTADDDHRSAPGGRVWAPAPSRWRAWVSAAVAAAAFFALAIALSSGLGLVDLAHWAGAQKRAFYDMITQLMGMKDNAFSASVALIGACLAYGFIHAAVPGHGKFLIAGAGLASRMTMVRLVALSVLASLAQAVTAIVLVYGSFSLLDITAGWAQMATDMVLVPASYVAVIVIALVLIRRAWRGMSVWFDAAPEAPAGHAHHDHDHAGHDHEDGCGHRHAPTLAEAEAIHSWRDALMLIVGIGLRPCTGAVFVLVAAWRLNLVWVGVAATVAMAIGTGAFISLVAVSAVSARGATLLASGARYTRYAIPLMQLLTGVAIFLIAAAFLADQLNLV
ncbi:hypothetical protein RDV64_20855 [Acuticoccus sp. MNP-M23]|uniref:nickel/cobalt transporter n=1 Tax=Acuticoccus sp. MNP-M23 TaxID=3072793 RepID=UPI002814E114|nr:hypothetical protein [Acuticoccus sp. MNP-M23]WMS42483.1 hypothetical protein RDV64_20855 [Acuticoccus sp. MNP-M23]